VDTASGVKSAPGVKDLAKVRAFVHAVREEDSPLLPCPHRTKLRKIVQPHPPHGGQRRRSLWHRTLGGLLLLLTIPVLANERGVKRVESFATADRHALVIGNSAYNHTSPLRNPVNDTQSMTISLQSLGFRVRPR
jgi:hypothetical protein